MPKKTKKVVTSNRRSGIHALKSLSMPVRLLILFVGLVTILGLSTYGYSTWKARDLQAKAGRYATIYDRDGFKIVACKKNVYGNTDSIVMLAVKPANKPGMATLIAYTGTPGVELKYSTGKSSTAWWGNTITAVEIPIYEKGWYEPKIWSVDRHYGPTPFVVAMSYTPYC